MEPKITSAIEQSKFPWPWYLIKCFIGGSELHGAKVKDTDDLDIYGLYIEPPERILGLERYEHHVWSTAKDSARNGPDDIDVTFYSLRKWAGMIAKGNPTALHFLFAENLLNTNGQMMMGELNPMFRRAALSKSCSSQFMGFVDAQMGRLLGTRGRGQKGQRPELEQKFGYDVKAGMHAVRLLYECIELMKDHVITLPRPEKEILIDIRLGRWSFDRLSSVVNELFFKLKHERERSSLPDEPDREAISKIVANAYRLHWECEAQRYLFPDPRLRFGVVFRSAENPDSK